MDYINKAKQIIQSKLQGGKDQLTQGLEQKQPQDTSSNINDLTARDKKGVMKLFRIIYPKQGTIKSNELSDIFNSFIEANIEPFNNKKLKNKLNNFIKAYSFKKEKETTKNNMTNKSVETVYQIDENDLEELKKAIISNLEKSVSGEIHHNNLYQALDLIQCGGDEHQPIIKPEDKKLNQLVLISKAINFLSSYDFTVDNISKTISNEKLSTCYENNIKYITSSSLEEEDQLILREINNQAVSNAMNYNNFKLEPYEY
ncbi:MAG: hypothetical protein HRT47_00880 [Candidatus Caenarcaniphilales bacterium]|nr:hypothetical protein [Candidatus Caenarcaniphilales bacterium]